MKKCFYILLCLFTPVHLLAQVDELQFLVATSIEDTEGKTWAYLRWQAPDPQILVDQKTAVFQKSGGFEATANFSSIGLCQLNRNPATIKVLLARGTRLGDNLNELEQDFDLLFDNIDIDPALTIEQKVAAAIALAEKQPEVYDTLSLFALSHPAIGLCLGQAFTVEISGVTPTTFELRICPDTITNPSIDCDRTIGRVSIDPTNVTPLPAPGAPFELEEATAKGHQNVRLRWSTPSDLRRVSLLQFGFNLYRVEQSYAEANGWDIAPPIDPFSNYDAQFITAISDLPILANPNLTDVEAMDASDTNTFFIIDDNEVYDGGTALQNGDSFYYFVTARDLLGRDGLASPGTLVTICDRIPPPPPAGVRVENRYTWNDTLKISKQRFEISWDPIPAERGEIPTAYGVFRWQNPQDAANSTDAQAANHLVSGPIAHTGNGERLSFVDDGLGSPNLVLNAGQTFWYTIRSIDDSACGGNIGPDSAPVFGVIRDRSGPDAPTGYLRIRCATPDVQFQPPLETATDPDDDGLTLDPTLNIRMNCTVDPTEIEWVEFSYGLFSNPSNRSPRIYINGQSNPHHWFSIERDPPGSGTISKLAYCRVGGRRGGVSSWAAANLFTLVSQPTAYLLKFDALLMNEFITADNDCNIHLAFKRDSQTGRPVVEPPQLTIQLQPKTEEWRVYRRIDDGPLTMIEQAFDAFTDMPEIDVADTNIPPNAALICYYAQLADRHGNISPMTRISCIETTSRTPMAIPLLNPIEAAGSETNQQMNITWFSTPEGVDHFEIWVRAVGSSQQDATRDATIDPRPAARVFEADVGWQLYETKRVGEAFAAGPDFSYQLNITPGWNYAVKVRGINRVGEQSPFSILERFYWAPPEAAAVQEVPWPARDLPPIEPEGIPKVTATAPTFGDPGTVQIAAIRIGEYYKGSDNFSLGSYNNGRTGPAYMDVLPKNGELTFYTGVDGKTVFPCVVYRYQVANDAFPKVSGDVYQVTPLIRTETAFDTSVADKVTVWDPFVDLALIPGTSNTYGLYIQDTQPVLRGAAYKYLIARFKDNGELDKIIPTNVLTLQ